MPYESILCEVAGPVCTITLNRPDALNAISRGLEAELHAALDAADADPQVRAIVLTGAGRAFSSGYDIARADGGRREPPEVSADEFLGQWYRSNMRDVEKFMHIFQLTKPVIAAVNGWAMGGGMWYATACDITIASERAVFAQPEVRMVSNTTYLFAALCGWKVANRYALTGDHIDAAEALRIGLVNEVVPHDELLSRARALGARIAMVPEASVRVNKAVTMLGVLSAGLFNGLLLNGPLSAIVHASVGGPERGKLDAAFREGGLRAFLQARDGPFTPEPFGPRSAQGLAPPAGEPAQRG